MYRSHCIGNCISEYYERIEENNHKSSDNNFNTRSPNINQSENAATINPLSTDLNILALALIPALDI